MREIKQFHYCFSTINETNDRIDCIENEKLELHLNIQQERLQIYRVWYCPFCGYKSKTNYTPKTAST